MSETTFSGDDGSMLAIQPPGDIERAKVIETTRIDFAVIDDPEDQETAQRVWHTIRTRDHKTKRILVTRKTAIKLMCTECLGWEDNPETCTAPTCPLFPFRGKSLASQTGD